MARSLEETAHRLRGSSLGRRIAEIDGGWRLLNHAKYRHIRSSEERREYMREYMRKRRAGEVA